MNLLRSIRLTRIGIACVLFALGNFVGAAHAASTVTVSEVEKSGANQGSMLVTLSTSDAPTAFEMDLLFDPRRVEVLSPVSPQFPGASADDYRLDSNLVAPGTLRVVLSSSKLKPLVDGTSMRVPVRAASGAAQLTDYLPVMVVNMEITDGQAQSLRPKLGTTIRVHGLESGVKYDGKGGLSLGLDLLKDPATSVSKVEYYVNSVRIQSGTGASAVTWTPPGSGTFELTAIATLADGGTVQSRMLPLIVSGLATRPVNASYAGAVMDTGSLRTAAATGAVTFVTTSAGSLGSYSMRLVLNGASVGVAGRFGAESIGSATVSAKLPTLGQKTLRLRFQQEATGLADTIRGVVTDGTLNNAGEASGGSFVSDFVASRNVWGSAKTTGTMGGKYNVRLPVVDGLGTFTPGFAAISLSNYGVVSALFTLGDGTKSSLSGWISTDGVWQPYASLYSNAGYLVGSIDLSDRGSAGTVGGSLDWRRNADQLRELDVNGSKYIAPTRGTVFPVERKLGNAVVRVSGGTLSGGFNQTVTLTSFNSVSVTAPNSYRLSLSVDRAGGAFTGTFWVPGTRTPFSISGVLMQDSLKGEGIYVPYNGAGTTKSGTVTFEAR